MAVTETEILATGTNKTESGAVLIELGTMVTVCLKDAVNTARATVELQDDADNWQPTGMEMTAAKPSLSLISPGNYRVVRQADGACGVFKVI
ncbi:hypothetical protein [Devosia sediminis]|uniref:Uncharacterized protein n=1 Tax=Devosia sediminis TaxID=2798801 RepID=A0A934MPK7_9HYPH|nr:hypothetical protein [Devosia sediminis]MBJ3783424.1 hypothetical protein [Devosia sediminis]